jgi:hypothetical protein
MLSMSESKKKKNECKIAFAVHKSPEESRLPRDRSQTGLLESGGAHSSSLVSFFTCILCTIDHTSTSKKVRATSSVCSARSNGAQFASWLLVHQYFRSFIYRNEKTLLNRGMSVVATTCAAN